MKGQLLVFLLTVAGTCKGQLSLELGLDPVKARLPFNAGMRYDTRSGFFFRAGTGFVMPGYSNEYKENIDTNFYYNYHQLPRKPENSYQRRFQGAGFAGLGYTFRNNSYIYAEYQRLGYQERYQYLLEDAWLVMIQGKIRKRISYGNYMDSMVNSRVNTFSLNIGQDFNLNDRFTVGVDFGVIFSINKKEIITDNQGLINDGSTSGKMYLTAVTRDFRNYQETTFVPLSLPRIRLTYRLQR